MQILQQLQSDPNKILLILLSFLLMIPALVLHELAHGWVAYKLGDTTAKRAGRLTLNPIKHIDWFGTLVLPLLLFIGSNGSFAFGYAKPVPINPNNFQNRKKGILLTGIAGPATNVILAIISAALSRLIILIVVLTGGGASQALSLIWTLLYQFAYINLMFAFFNLIPIPPLDGSRVLQYFLPRSAHYFYSQLERWGFIIILALMWVPTLFGFTSPFDYYFNYTVIPLVRLLTGAG